MTGTACPSCGRTNADDARFCAYCSAELLTTGAPDVRKLVTLVFSDLKGSTALGERSDPEVIRGVMSRYYEAMRAVVEAHGGTVEKFVGDAVMAAFGIPQVHEDDALRAVRAATEMRAEQERLNEEFERRFGVRIEVRTGVNTGEVIAGDPSREETFATGDAVNVAARLEQAAPGGEILIGESTYRLVRDAIEVEPVEPLVLKGKAYPMRAYRLIDVRAGAPSLARRLDLPLVGRERELAELLSAFERSEEERALLITLVLADAGVGKSRLAAELVSRIESRATVLQGRCLHYGEGITFWPVAEMVRAAASVDDSDSPAKALAKVEALLPAGAEAAGLAQGVGTAIGLAETELTIGEVFHSIRRLFESLAEERPLALVFDDLQWAEETLFDLVEYLARTSHRAPILLVCLARPELGDRRREWRATFNSLELSPLSEGESGRMAAELLGAPVEQGLLTRLNEAAHGNPLFVEELLRMLVDEGSLKRRNGTWAASGELAGITAPPTIEALLSARLERLTSPERSLLEAASVVGQVFWPGAVAELIEVDEAVDDSLEDLLQSQLLVSDPGGFAGEEAFRFAHILIRDAAYGRLLKATRSSYHERFARWLERKAGDRLPEYEEIVGHHLAEAHRYRVELGPPDADARVLADEAAMRLGSAGGRAYEREDVAGAIGLLERAVSLLGEGDTRRARLLVDLGMPLTDAGTFDRADRVLTEAAEAAAAAGDRNLELRALVERSFGRSSTDPEGSYDERVGVGSEAIRALEAAGDDVGSARALALAALTDGWAGQGRDSEAKLRRAMVHATRAGVQRLRNEILFWLAGTLWMGPTPTSEAVRSVEELGGSDGWSHLWALAPLYAMRGEFDRARSLVRQAQGRFDEFGLEVQAAATCQTSAWIELLAGEPVLAETKLRPGYEQLTAMGERGYLATVVHLLAEALCAQDRWKEAELLSHEAEELTAPDDFDAQIGWRRSRARALAQRGETDEARRLAEEALRVARRTDNLWQQADSLVVLAEVLEQAGESAGVADAIKEAIDLYEAKENLVSARSARDRLAELTI